MFSSSLLGLSLDALSDAQYHRTPNVFTRAFQQEDKNHLKILQLQLMAFLDILQRAINPRKDTFCVSRVKPLSLQHTILKYGYFAFHGVSSV